MKRIFVQTLSALFLVLCCFATLDAQTRLVKTESVPRHLIICLDGVGFATMQEMRDAGKFRRFQTPARMLAPFPSLTNPAMGELLKDVGAREPLGYEETFFDVTSNKIRGGVFERFNDRAFIKGSFRELFDYHPSALKSGLGYVAPPVSTYLESITDIIRLRQKFKDSEAPVYFVYSGATDSLAHLGGKRMLRSFLARLDDTLEDLHKDYPNNLRVTIFSDHGNHFTSYRRSDIQRAVRRAGFKINKRLENNLSVVIPQFGLIGCALLFTDEANERRLAEAVVAAKGVDFAAFSERTPGGEIVHVIAANQASAIIEKQGNLYRYIARRGDPLGLQSTVAKLKTNFADGFISEAAWFEATQTDARPDAAVRVYRGTTNLVGNRANVIVNFQNGFYSGSRTLDVFAFLRATHGNLAAEQSNGFVIDTTINLPFMVRAADVWRQINNPLINKRNAPHPKSTAL